MVSVVQRTRLGPKGQVVIPKLLRDSLGMYPGSDVLVELGEGKVVIKKDGEDMVEIAERIAKKGKSVRMSPKKMRHLEIAEEWGLT
ncbi:AbrB/MazE/SpoVT family DNA-binding domain-containing protein [Candidatus Woesearchaeota archaeon]|nr:AbrB/MazE/SpoVT family DNA-binding domain-containing protein [Candidatus Woesearchaeota archaeon]